MAGCIFCPFWRVHSSRKLRAERWKTWISIKNGLILNIIHAVNLWSRTSVMDDVNFCTLLHEYANFLLQRLAADRMRLINYFAKEPAHFFSIRNKISTHYYFIWHISSISTIKQRFGDNPALNYWRDRRFRPLCNSVWICIDRDLPRLTQYF